MPNIALTTVQVPIKVGGVKVPTTYEVMVQPDDLKKFANLDAFVTEKTTKAAIASFDDGADNIPMKSLLVYIDPVQSGSGDPSPDNVRAISGHSSVKVNARGTNIFDEQFEVGAFGESGGKIIKVSASALRTKNPIPVKPNTKYRIVTNDNSYAQGYFVGMIEDLTTWNGYGIPRTSVNSLEVTTGAKTHYMVFALGANYGTTYKNDTSVNYPSTDTDYHPYNSASQDLTISLGQTVYGGVLDVVSGVLNITSQKLKFSDLNWAYISSLGLFDAALTNTYKDNPQNCVCDTYKFIGSYVGIAENQMGYLYTRSIGVKDSTFGTDVNAFIQARGNVEFTVELRTPIEVQLTPTEVDTLLGSNNIWADTGDVVAEYRADATLLYEKIMAAIGA